VINPLYCYEGGRLNLKNAFDGKDPVQIKRAAVIVHRGWIPAEYRDKRSRPNDFNSSQLVRVTGTWRKGKNVHDYKVPNNPNNNEWNNLCLEDIGIFWDLSNFDECKFYYFQAVDLTGADQGDTPVQAYKPDEIIDEHYKWKWNENQHKTQMQVFGALSGVSMMTAFLCML